MTQCLYMSKIYAPTLKETPSDADIVSHKFLLRAAMVRKVSSGIYTYLPLGMKVLKKIETIIREEMDAIGAQEMLMPALQPAELWHESKRWDEYGPELMRLTDRHDHDFALGPTHEELITSIMRDELRSYRQLPIALYQIQTKYRDEIRPRFGLLRSREFIMKDAYSFHNNQLSLDEMYGQMRQAYERICDRCGINYRIVEADSGQIGGSATHEFMAIAESGEATIAYCPACNWAADTEIGECIPNPKLYQSNSDALQKIATPGIKTIDALAKFLHCPTSATVKAMVGKDVNNTILAIFIPGDHELNELKVQHAFEGFELLNDDELKETTLPKGSIGPIHLPEKILCIADRSLEAIPQWVVGANEDGYHYIGATYDRDFNVDKWLDLCNVEAHDQCPQCGCSLETAQGIEVAQIFQLGDKYSKNMSALFSDEDGKDRPFLMGCYGMGVSRMLAAIVEQNNDDNGIIWPISVAPAQICILPLLNNDEIVDTAQRIAEYFLSRNIEVVIDDRNVRPGVKFADAELIGWPFEIILGKKTLQNRTIEVKDRRVGDKIVVPFDDIKNDLSFIIDEIM